MSDTTNTTENMEQVTEQEKEMQEAESQRRYDQYL